MLSAASFVATRCRHHGSPPLLASRVRHLSSGEVAAALRPFFFSVHPDRFGQHPKERAVNENSLKQLNAYMESLLQLGNGGAAANMPWRRQHAATPVKVTFYLRTKANNGPDSPTESFRPVQISLGNGDVKQVVVTILQTCNLPTTFVESLPSPAPAAPEPGPPPSPLWPFRSSSAQRAEEQLRRKRSQPQTLEGWLERYGEEARMNLEGVSSMREEVVRLRKELCDQLGLQQVTWDCGWGLRHFRGCLQSFMAVATHHHPHMHVLKGRTLVFGRQTGVGLDGHIVLNSGEVRHNWLDLIRNVPKHDQTIRRIPAVQKAVSCALNDIKVVHREFQPKLMAETYEAQLRRVLTTLGDHRGRYSLPRDWPPSLSHLEMAVETEACPLMLTPSGQFLVPASCPAFLLISFITDSMEEARLRLHRHLRDEQLEKDLKERCMRDLSLDLLRKEDNVDAQQMISCLQRLITHSHQLRHRLEGAHLCISTYYSLLSDGEMCIPWNWIGEDDQEQ